VTSGSSVTGRFPGRACVGLTFSCLLFSSVALADSLSVGRDLVTKMSTAMQTLTYSGSFVYSHDDAIESMQIFRSNAGGVERQRLVSLNGEAREIIHHGEQVICIWPGSKSVEVLQAAPATPFPAFEPDELAKLDKLYQFEHRGKGRIAGRQVEVVDIMPMDNYRYGYRLSIDAETYLILRSEMRDRNGSVVEQVMFTEIEYSDSLPPALLQAAAEEYGQEWMTAILDKPLHPPTELEASIPGIHFLEVPEGFVLISDTLLALPEHPTVRRALYTDGIASLSVYIGSALANTQDELQGLIRMGSAHAYGVMQDKWHVTVVGEVPKSAVKMTADSLQLALNR